MFPTVPLVARRETPYRPPPRPQTSVRFGEWACIFLRFDRCWEPICMTLKPLLTMPPLLEFRLRVELAGSHVVAKGGAPEAPILGMIRKSYINFVFTGCTVRDCPSGNRPLGASALTSYRLWLISSAVVLGALRLKWRASHRKVQLEVCPSGTPSCCNMASSFTPSPNRVFLRTCHPLSSPYICSIHSSHHCRC
ncbi:hypothetical protein NEOLEDRAFT_743787 [Neolentinus lepideus HHB14362 ss-1]|uniref:Uncharacterized protein n=1 Tax=Neolentinus lepideus HHB14362 ss-1 TaxID=1314782 RepID=A0A165PX29_9AGAM|nr:hypothetical protein NEOLEDRAFT_743787 [Neolentinus lepideus HHB14362 ss-1]